MNKKLVGGLWIGVLLLGAVQIGRAQGQPAEITGYVIDSACAFTKNLKKPISPDCAVACAKAGSPLVILSDGGRIYWPISGTTPAQGQNDRLMEFAGKRVIVTGKVYQRGGSQAIVIAGVQAEK